MPSPPGPAPAVAADASPRPAQARAANRPATAALVCGILGGALITIPAGLLLACLGFRRGNRGLARCWVGPR